MLGLTRYSPRDAQRLYNKYAWSCHIFARRKSIVRHQSCSDTKATSWRRLSCRASIFENAPFTGLQKYSDPPVLRRFWQHMRGTYFCTMLPITPFWGCCSERLSRLATDSESVDRFCRYRLSKLGPETCTQLTPEFWTVLAPPWTGPALPPVETWFWFVSDIFYGIEM
ncbi:hypothetical protein BJ166DRAFT_543728 [Pestalotiopsis sp. NC0098]|nr:hypothetical protein BJ166DRAFT_543728 [Pestalotiopsis sp. NC0098]